MGETETDQRPAKQPGEKNGPKHFGFVQVVCPSPLVTTGVDRILEEVGIRHGPEPPKEDVPYCVLLCWAGDAASLREPVERTREASPDDAPILVLGWRNDPLLAWTALRARARGFLHIGMTPAHIVRALSVCSEGKLVAPREELLEFLVKEWQYISASTDALSERQREILELVGEGLTNAQVAERLSLTESTVKQHLRTAYKILGVTSRTEAVRLIRRADAAG
jgi:DNA-binding NarL/FixJ family response regulator